MCEKYDNGKVYEYKSMQMFWEQCSIEGLDEVSHVRKAMSTKIFCVALGRDDLYGLRYLNSPVSNVSCSWVQFVLVKCLSFS